MNAELFRAARAYVERLDFSLCVTGPSKIPNIRFFPHGVTDATKDLDLIERAISGTRDPMLAARVARHLVVDADVRSGAVDQLAKSLVGFGPFPRTWTAETPTGGVHVWFRPVDFFVHGTVLGKVELLRGNRLVTLSPSRRSGGRYRWLQSPLDTELAEAPQWLQRISRVAIVDSEPRHACEVEPQEREIRARAYFQVMDGAVSGSHGHARTFLAAQYAVRGFWLDDDTAFSVLSAWNHFCDPPWSDAELKRKIVQARLRGRMPFGDMLAEKTRAA